MSNLYTPKMSTPEHGTDKAHPFFATMETIPSAVQYSPTLKPLESSSSHFELDEPPSPAILKYLRRKRSCTDRPRHDPIAIKAAEWARARGIKTRKHLEDVLSAYNSGRPNQSSSTLTTQMKSIKKSARKSNHTPPSSSQQSGEPQTNTTSTPTTTATLVSLAPKPLTGIHKSLPSPKYRTISGPSIIEAARYLKSLPNQPKPSKRRGRYGYKPPGRSPLRDAVEVELSPSFVNNQSALGDCGTAVPVHCEASQVHLVRKNCPNLDNTVSRGIPKTQGHKVPQPHKSLGIIQHAKPLQFSKLTKPVCFGVPGSMYSRVTLRAPGFKAPPLPRRELVKQQLLALPDYQGVHAPISPNLLGLPYEVRLAILERVLVTNDTVNPFYDEGKIKIPRKYRHKHLDRNYDTAVLRVNQQLHQEASCVLYIGNSFVLTHPEVAKWWMERIGGNLPLLYAVAIFLTTGVDGQGVTWEEHWASFFAWLGLRHHPKVFSINFESWVELKLTSASNRFGLGQGHTSELTLASAALNRVYTVDLLSKMRGFNEVNLYLGDFMSRNAGMDLLIAMMAPFWLKPMTAVKRSAIQYAEDRMKV